MNPYISLVVPAYNEETRLKRSLDGALEYLGKHYQSHEVVVVDDGSTDNTTPIAAGFGYPVRAIRQQRNYGKGAAVRRGMLEARGQVRIFSDADFSTPIYEIEKLLNGINAGADICIGSRAVDFSMIKLHQPFYREFMGKTFNKIVQALVIEGIKDTQCGFKGFTEKAAIEIFRKAKIDGFGFDVEVLYIARKAGMRIDEVPVEWYNDLRSTVNPVVDSIKMLFEISKIRRLHKNQQIRPIASK